MDTFISNSESETITLGESWGKQAHPGWVFGLIGPLGAGKTRLVQGIALGLGTKSRVRSPTFTLVHEYRGGRWPLFHIDLYRIQNAGEFESAGLDEYLFTPGGITVVEWFDRLPLTGELLGWIPQGGMLRRVLIEIWGETTRRISYEDTRA